MTTSKTIKATMLGVLVAVLFVPSMGMNSAAAETTPYTLEEIESAFSSANGGDYVTTDEKNVMKVDTQKSTRDNVSEQDSKIMSEWAELHNGAMKAMASGDENVGIEYYKSTLDGKFSLLTNMNVPTIPHPDERGNSKISLADYTIGETRIIPVGYWSLSACGITYGSTQHSNPSLGIGVSGEANLASAQLTISNYGYTQLQTPYTDSGSVGYDYGKKNLSGQGGCTSGEFRDQHFIYTSGTHWIGGTPYGPTHSLTQVNEPNANLAEYSAPTYWWDTYTYFWHLAN